VSIALTAFAIDASSPLSCQYDFVPYLPARRVQKLGGTSRSTLAPGVELKGVSWRWKEPRAGIETEGPWAERDDGKSP